MKNLTETLLDFAKKKSADCASNKWENIILFANFLNMRGFQKSLAVDPDMYELYVEISFDEKGCPTIELSGIAPSTGHTMMPFSQQFVEEIAIELLALEGTEDDLGIRVFLPGDGICNTGYQFFWHRTD